MKKTSQGEDRVNPVQVQRFLKGLDYPVSKQEVINYAKKHGADQRVIETLERMEDQTFDMPADISQAIGKFE